MAKILIIEDEWDQIQMIKSRLESRGYQVISARKAEEGIKLAQEEKPDLILMDMLLPGMHGLEAAMKLKKNPKTKKIPIIALTAVSTPDLKKACFKKGISAFIKKPYEPEELLNDIEKNIRETPKSFDQIESVEKEFEDTLSGPDIDIQAKDKTKIEKEKNGGKIQEKEKRIREEDERTKIPKKILIIDDNPNLVKTLGMRLMASGYEVKAASDGVNGVKLAHQERPDLILLDIIMPGEGGGSVFKNLKKSLYTTLIPVIFISGILPPKELEEKANKLGAEGAIPKPFDGKELIAKIKKILGE